MAEVDWTSAQQRTDAERLVRLVLTRASQPLDKRRITEAVVQLRPELQLTASHVNSILYTLRHQHLVRQADKQAKRPHWELACRAEGRIDIREVRRGCFWLPKGPELPWESCPYPYRLEPAEIGHFLYSTPAEAEAMARWLNDCGLSVRLLRDQLEALPTFPQAELGDFYLQPAEGDWQFYDPARLAWRRPVIIRRGEHKNWILRKGWSLRTRRSDRHLFYLAQPDQLDPLDNEDQAILRVLDRRRGPALPAIELEGLVLVDVADRWLPPSWFKWLSALRPSQKYPAEKLAVAAADKPLLTEALQRLGLSLGPWPGAESPAQPAATLNDEIHEHLCRLFNRLGEQVHPQLSARELPVDTPEAVRELVDTWLADGLLARQQGRAPITALVLDAAPAWRYRQRKLAQNGYRLLVFIPDVRRVVNYLVPALPATPGHWLRFSRWSLYLGLGLLRGQAEPTVAPDAAALASLRGDFATERARLLQPEPGQFLPDFAPAFPHTGRPSRVAAISCRVTAGLAEAGAEPSLRVVDSTGAGSELFVAWDLYSQDRHPVHTLTAGAVMEPLVKFVYVPRVGVRAELLALDTPGTAN